MIHIMKKKWWSFEKMSFCKPFQYISRGEDEHIEAKHNANLRYIRINLTHGVKMAYVK